MIIIIMIIIQLLSGWVQEPKNTYSTAAQRFIV